MAALGTRLLKLEVGGTDYTAQVTEVRISVGDADSDVTTFADAAAGGSKEWRLEFNAIQDLAADTLWSEVWENPGTTVAFEILPYGNATPSASEPHFTGNAVISLPDGDILGGTADASSTAKMQFSASWVCTAQPTRVTA